MASKREGKVISISSVKGGVGKTTMTINLAGIYYLLGNKVLIIDADFFSGGVSTWLDIRNKRDIYMLVSNIANNKYTLLKDYVTPYNSGIDIISSPRDPRSAMKIDSKYIPVILELAKEEYDVILVDTNHIMNELNLMILDNSYMSLLIVTNDLIDLKNMKSIISIFKDADKKNYLICLNSSRDTGKDYLSLFDIRNVIKANIDYTVSNSFYIKNIDKYVMNGEILTLNKTINRFHQADIERLNNIAKELISDKYKESAKMSKKTLMDAFEVKTTGIKIDNIEDYDVFKNKDLLDKLRGKIIQNLIDENIPDDKLLDQYINDEIDASTLGYDLNYLQRNYIYNLIKNEINGYGPITEMLDDDRITEIMVNGPNSIYVEIDGKIVKDDSVSFINDKHILRTIQRIVQPLGRTIDTSNPMVDARLRDGSRLNAIIPPLSLTGPVLTIRKFAKDLEQIDDLLMKGTLTNDMAIFLEACVKAKLNILISGGTGTGKTTLLNILSSFIGSDERIITIEDAAELRLHQQHVISLETRTTNYEGEGEVTIRDLVRNSLRMRPDRIIVGEVRGKEAFDMMQAMNTGHEGSITTLHANNPVDAINRLETMILMNEMEIPVSAVRGYIENAIDIVVQIDRLTDGRRKITSIGEITGINDTGNIIINPIFSYNQKGTTEDGMVEGEFKLNRKNPKVYEKISRKGIKEIDRIFKK